MRSCRICRCTDFNACIQPDGFPCCWVEDDLCSSCAYFETDGCIVLLETDEPYGKEVELTASPTIFSPDDRQDDERISKVLTALS